jgi:hypothetical protein
MTSPSQAQEYQGALEEWNLAAWVVGRCKSPQNLDLKFSLPRAGTLLDGDGCPVSPPPLLQCLKQGIGHRALPLPLAIAGRRRGGAVNQHSPGRMQLACPPGVPSGHGVRTLPHPLLLRLRTIRSGKCSLHRPFVLGLLQASTRGRVNYNSQGPRRQRPGRAGG